MRGLRKSLPIPLISLLVLVIALGSLACASEEAPEVTPTPTPQATPIIHKNSIDYAIEALQRLPIEWKRGRYIDLEAFRSDSSLLSFYESCRNEVGQGLATIGIDLNQVDHVSFVGGRAAVYSGRLDLASIKRGLDSMNYDKTTYLDTEIWQSSNPEKGVVTLLSPNSVLVTKEYEDAEMCITVLKGWGSSFYDNEGFKDVIARLPNNPLRLDFWQNGDSGLLAAASTTEKVGSGAFNMMTLAAFVDDVMAGEGLPEITADFNSWARSWNMVSVESAQIRRFVKSTGIANFEDVKKADNLLGYQAYWLN